MKLMSKALLRVVYIPKFDISCENTKPLGIKGSRFRDPVISRFTSFFEQTTIFP